MNLEFKIIPSFPDYEVSNNGIVRTRSRKIRYTHSVTGKEHFRYSETRLLKEHFNKRTGYIFYQLYKNKKMFNRPVHRLVADAFLEKTEGLNTVNHIDGNKLNNSIDNLEWCTLKYNHDHATKYGLKPSGERIATSKLTEICIKAIRAMIADGISHSKIASYFGVNKSTITMISTGSTWARTLPAKN